MHKPRTRRHGCPSMSTRRFVNLRRAGHAGPAACSRVIAGSTTSRRASPVEDPGVSAGVSGTPYATLHAKSVAEGLGKRIMLCALPGWHGELRRVSPKLAFARREAADGDVNARAAGGSMAGPPQVHKPPGRQGSEAMVPSSRFVHVRSGGPAMLLPASRRPFQRELAPPQQVVEAPAGVGQLPGWHGELRRVSPNLVFARREAADGDVNARAAGGSMAGPPQVHKPPG